MRVRYPVIPVPSAAPAPAAAAGFPELAPAASVQVVTDPNASSESVPCVGVRVSFEERVRSRIPRKSRADLERERAVKRRRYEAMQAQHHNQAADCAPTGQNLGNKQR